MTVTVYKHPLSPDAQKVKIALSEQDTHFEAPLPAALGSAQVAADFKAASPRGEAQALIDADVAIFNSSVILEWRITSGGIDVVLEGLARGNIRFAPQCPS